MARRYRFVGEGAGVPGLPHELTDEEARLIGMLEVLEAAVKNGNYSEVKAEPPAKSRRAAGEVEE